MKECGRPAGRAGFVPVDGNGDRMGREKALLPCGDGALAAHAGTPQDWAGHREASPAPVGTP